MEIFFYSDTDFISNNEIEDELGHKVVAISNFTIEDKISIAYWIVNINTSVHMTN